MNDNGFINIQLRKENIDLYYHRRTIFNKLKENLNHFKGKLIDVGCGGMPYKEFILNNSQVNKYVGLDINDTIIYNDKIKPDVLWDGQKIPLEDNEFHCALATEVLEHVPEPKIYLSEVNRILKPTGSFVFTTPFLWPLHESPNDEFRYTPFSLIRLLKDAGFTDIQVEALGGWNASLAQMLGLWLLRSPMKKRKRIFLLNLLFPIYKLLLKKDNKKIGDGKMITGLFGIAFKN